MKCIDSHMHLWDLNTGTYPWLTGVEDKETAEEKRVRLTKSIIKEYAADDRTDFFATLAAKT